MISVTFISVIILGCCFTTAGAINSKNVTQEACMNLSDEYDNLTWFPGSDRYDYENTYSWTTSAWLNPACVFTPQSSQQVSYAIKLFSKLQVQFAIRGGGGMPIDTAANIGPQGILISSTNLTTMSLNDDSSVASAGPGVTWPDFYSFLSSYNVTVNGIRMGNVGVVGFLLGGGIGFFSYEHGIASTMVKSFEVVLGSGEIVTASDQTHSDLFWALRGGGNNFGMVTKAELSTIPNWGVRIGAVSFGSDVQDRYIQSLEEFAHYADLDPLTSMESQIRWVPSDSLTERSYDAFLFHNNDDLHPAGLQNFSAPVLPITTGNLTNMTMGEWANSFPYSSDVGFREIFHFLSVPANKTAMTIITETYFNATYSLANVTGYQTALSTMPITSLVAELSTGFATGLGDSSAPSFWVVESPTWLYPADDAQVLAAHTEANEQIIANLAAAGFSTLPFVYLSDSEKTEFAEVWQGYGVENVRKLQAIRNKYDPEDVFTKLVSGGAKVAYA
ncbi:hypothetical protein BX600DRAFT_386550 [Xylariales sp. PMI_506]|nr:hypothetical protein BX600DRAFT_386550 [Xylariales sp. PMI_506]